MISCWSEWKRYPRVGRGENIEAPIGPGIYEVRIAATGALFTFEAVDNIAQALSLLAEQRKPGWFARRGSSPMPELDYRFCATSTRADAKTALERMVGRGQAYWTRAA